MKNLIKGSLVILSAWFGVYYLGLSESLFLPNPIETFQVLIDYLSNGEYWKNISSTLFRFFFGLLIGVFFGIPSGLLIGSNKKIHSFFEFPIDFFRSLPVTALFPLFLLIFGIGDNSKIAMVSVAVYFIMLINSYYAIIQSKKQRQLMGKIFRASKIQIFRDIVIMEALPQIFIGMRLALSTSLIVVIVSEMFIGTEFGLGQRVYDLYSKNLIVNLYANLVIIGFIGYIINKFFLLLEKKILFWVGK